MCDESNAIYKNCGLGFESSNENFYWKLPCHSHPLAEAAGQAPSRPRLLVPKVGLSRRSNLTVKGYRPPLHGDKPPILHASQNSFRDRTVV